MNNVPDLQRNLSAAQLKYAMYLPAVFPPYAEAAIAATSKYRSMPNGLTPKDLNFLDPASKLFYLPAALYSAGHERGDLSHPKPNMITRRDEAATLVFGDSGGYQIISGNIHPNNDTKRAGIFNWQKDVCDFAMTLDVPTASIESEKSRYNDFRSCLSDTQAHLKTFKRLYDEAGQQPKLLNVMQGRNAKEADEWYAAVKNFDFNGWAIAGPLKADLYEVIRRILILLDDGKFGGSFEWLHFLGIGDLKTAALLTLIRNCIRRYLGTEDFHVSFDTSSPFLVMGKYNGVYTGHTLNRRQFTFTSVDFPVGDHRYLGSTRPFPYPTSPMGRSLTMGDLIVVKRNIAKSRLDTLSTFMLMNHNIYVVMNAVFEANRVMEMHRAEAREFAPPKLLDAREAIEDIFAASDPEAELQRQKRILQRV